MKLSGRNALRVVFGTVTLRTGRTVLIAVSAPRPGTSLGAERGPLPHIRRCIDAGLLEQAGTRGTWKLSAAGIDALNKRNEAWSRATPCFTR